MSAQDLQTLLEQVAMGALPTDVALQKLRRLGISDLGIAKIDVSRVNRVGIPEVVFCQGKSTTQVLQIMETLFVNNGQVLCTRVSEETSLQLRSWVRDNKFDNNDAFKMVYDLDAKLFYLKKRIEQLEGHIGVISAGTTDIPVAREASITADFLNVRVTEIYDVGVAGLHRLLAVHDQLNTFDVVIVVAGMDAALAAVVGGLVAKPIIAVPTSVGYGASFSGLSALLSMLTSCSPGVTVVNIDNGFGAAVAAQRIVKANVQPY